MLGVIYFWDNFECDFGLVKDGSRGSDEDVVEYGEFIFVFEGIVGDSIDNWFVDRGDLVLGFKEIVSVCFSNWNGIWVKDGMWWRLRMYIFCFLFFWY